MTNLPVDAYDADFVIGAYHQLWRIEQSLRMSKHDLQARPIYHRTKDSIEAHLSVVFAALAITRWVEDQTGWTIRKFVRTARRYRTIEIQAGEQIITAEDPYPKTSPTPSRRSTASTLGTRLAQLGFHDRRWQHGHGPSRNDARDFSNPMLVPRARALLIDTPVTLVTPTPIAGGSNYTPH